MLRSEARYDSNRIQQNEERGSHTVGDGLTMKGPRPRSRISLSAQSGLRRITALIAASCPALQSSLWPSARTLFARRARSMGRGPALLALPAHPSWPRIQAGLLLLHRVSAALAIALGTTRGHLRLQQRRSTLPISSCVPSLEGPYPCRSRLSSV